MEYTNLTDRFNNKVYVGSILRSNLGNYYVIKRDEHLGFILYDPYHQLIEKVTKEVMEGLTVLPDYKEKEYERVNR